MADIHKIIMKEFNGTDFDTLHPQTIAEQIIESDQKRFSSKAKQDEWDAKVDASSLGTAAAKDVGTTSGQIPVLNAQGKLDDLVIPRIAITDTFPVNNESEMLALDAQIGDIAIRVDESKSFILRVGDPTVLENWEYLPSPTDEVQSVNGKKGTVVLTKDDVGLGKVDNKSVTEILTDTVLTGTPTAPTPDADSNDASIATTKYVKDAIAGFTPGGAVTSVNGKTGEVVIAKTDVGLGKVDNKSVTEILTDAVLTGVPTAPTAAANSNDTTVATTAFVAAKMENVAKVVMSDVEPVGLNVGDYWYQIIQ